MDAEKLKEILELHAKWVAGTEGGVRADLHGAYLYGANLREADLYGANLGGANLEGITVNWTSHDLLAEILRRAAERDNDDYEKLMVAGLPLVTRSKCWDYYCALPLNDDVKEWAMNELAKWVKDGDDAPEEIREAARRQKAAAQLKEVAP